MGFVRTKRVGKAMPETSFEKTALKNTASLRARH